MAQSNFINKPFTELFDRIKNSQAQDSIILTPNKRLSRFLRDQYNRYQREQTDTANAWSALSCVSYQGWLQQNWQELAVSGLDAARETPLSSTQELLLWQRVIENHPNTPPLLSANATAKLAMQAWRLVHEWHLDLNHSNDRDTQFFLQWSLAFSEVCAEKSLVSSVLIPAHIAEAIREQRVPTPSLLLLYGFDDDTPQQRDVFDALKAQGTQIESVDFHHGCQSNVRYEFSEESKEIEASALWAKRILQDQPDARIAIVAPQLAQQRARIERIFNRVFEPQSILPQQRQHAPGFNISAGQPLDQVPVVATALTALRCNQYLLDIESVSQLLLSPFIGRQTELHSRALLDISLRKEDYQLSLQQVKTAAGKFEGCADLYERIDAFTAIRKQAKKKLFPSQWAEVFTHQLQALGWPGERTLDTLEYQELQSWKEALIDFAAMDHALGEVDLKAGIHALQTLLKQISFQAQTKTSPIQILGILEAAGLPFDYLWLLSMDDETWPPVPNPNPFIPIALQTAKQLPQSSADRELNYARRLTDRLINSASTVVFSHAAVKDDKHSQASPLTEKVATTTFNLQPPETALQVLFKTRDIESSVDSCGPKVMHPDTIRGGTQVLKDQAACPFRAFARHRLHTTEMPRSILGLDASERGTLVHEVMEIIWRKLRTQAKLLRFDDAELDQLINETIDTALLDIKTKRFAGERFITIEKQRLAKQVHQWLDIEKRRSPFSVMFNEGRKTVKLGKLPLHIRYDRVDKLEDGRLFVLDYKTGKQEVRSWFGERPDEPQVPLYCIANSKKVAGAAFGQITADQIAIKGIADDESLAPDIKTPEQLKNVDQPQDWPTIVSEWQATLDRLAQEFMAGSAEVDPKIPGQTCRFCELKTLCRIKEQFSQEVADHE